MPSTIAYKASAIVGAWDYWMLPILMRPSAVGAQSTPSELSGLAAYAVIGSRATLAETAYASPLLSQGFALTGPTTSPCPSIMGPLHG